MRSHQSSGLGRQAGGMELQAGQIPDRSTGGVSVADWGCRCCWQTSMPLGNEVALRVEGAQKVSSLGKQEV